MAFGIGKLEFEIIDTAESGETLIAKIIRVNVTNKS
jgi:hypothetical protein